MLPLLYSRKQRWVRSLLAVLTGLILAVSPALSQPGPNPGGDVSAAAESKEEQDLSKQSTDPTAPLMVFSLQNWFTASFHHRPGTANAIVFRPVIPFQTGDLNHLLRVTLPYVSHSPASSGLSDTVVFDLLVFNASWGRWGLGPVLVFPTATRKQLGSEKWSAGPAVGAVAPVGKWQFGVFVQSAFSFAGASNRRDVQFVTIQPIIAYQLGRGWALSAGQSSFDYDFEIGRWTRLGIALQLGKVFRFAGFNWRVFVAPDYNFKDDPGLAKWTLQGGLNLLLPTAGKKK